MMSVCEVMLNGLCEGGLDMRHVDQTMNTQMETKEECIWNFQLPYALIQYRQYLSDESDIKCRWSGRQRTVMVGRKNKRPCFNNSL